MKALILALLLAAFTLTAADVSGKWSGTAQFTTAEGEARSIEVHMIFKQEGTRLSGSAGPDEYEQRDLQNGKVEGDRLTFEIPTGDGIVSFDLRANGDQIEGEAKGESGFHAKLRLKRKAA